MKFILNNICVIHYAEIELEGITLIAGENGSGKSTVEKSISLALSSLYNLSEFVRSERIAMINNTLKSAGNAFDVILKNISGAKRRHKVSEINKLQSDYSQKIADNIPFENDELTELVKEYSVKQAQNYAVDGGHLLNNKEYSEWLSKTIEDLKKDISYSDDEIGESSITDGVHRFFSDQIVNVNSLDAESSIEIFYDDLSDKMSFTRLHKSTKDICNNLVVQKAVSNNTIYIDSPDVFDTISGINIDDNDKPALQNTVRYLLSPGYSNKEVSKKNIWNVIRDFPSTVIDKEQNWKMMENFYQMIEDTVHGHFAVTSSKRLQFVPADKGRPIEMCNVSSGVKALSVLSYAMENGFINDNSILLLDEPEINLHPDWQMKYAELIVKMQKEIGVKTVITTHSPYFVEAIEAYSSHYGISKHCRYYFSEISNNVVTIHDVTSDTKPIYKRLAEPFRKLEKIEENK